MRLLATLREVIAERRASPERAEQDAHPHAFVPQGGGPPEGHRCLGLEYSSTWKSSANSK